MTALATAASSHFHLYIREVKDTPLLTADDENELSRRVAQGDPEARDTMVRSNLRLVITIARRYLGRGLPLEDLVAEGNLGLLRAVEAFDGARGIRFCTYASYWIKQSIRGALIKQGKTLRLPTYLVVLVGKWRRAAAQLADELGREPTHEEVARALRLNNRRKKSVGLALRVSNMTHCTDDEDADEGSFLARLLVDGRGRLPEEQVEEEDTLARIMDRLEELDDRQRAVIRLRFGLGGGSPLTLREIGERLGLTRERVRQLEQRALAALLESVD